MRPLLIPGGMPDDPRQAIEWLHERIREIEIASQEENYDIADSFIIENLPSKVYALDCATATPSDIAAVLGTLIMDMQRRGKARAV